MKNIVILICLMAPLSVSAEIVPPPANYTMMADDTVIDSTGQVNDDPDQSVNLNATEKTVVRTTATQVETKVEQDWKTRHDDAVLTDH